ncbi:metal ABC transporter permease [Dictyobacter formicarum]|uniref:ABC transporter permease n=1 Tax=Dictyobacter formicarum TaxID=2778368 RepID=A0ABQ3VBX8_9CHLR|nr:metal ABC transporter permease [Dictyobacter formicarum]GHO83549.1 ABC transporter permease [Dictyobacter formicarum]
MLYSIMDSLQYEFVRNALLAGSCIAIVAAIAGYFLIARGLTFASHALPNIGFAGAAGAVLLGLSPVYGLFAFTIGAGIIIGLLGKEVRERDITIGIIMTSALGLGLMFLSLYSGYAERVYNVLFGTILGISTNDVQTTIITCLLTIIATIVLYRPLLFSSFDPIVAEARGVPIRGIAIIFLVLVAMAVSIAIQIVGALLMFTMLVGPAATAIRIAQRPLWAIVIAIVLGLAYMWAGILLSVANGLWPASFYIATISFAIYLPVRILSPHWLGKRGRHERTPTRQPIKPQESERAQKIVERV